MERMRTIPVDLILHELAARLAELPDTPDTPDTPDQPEVRPTVPQSTVDSAVMARPTFTG